MARSPLTLSLLLLGCRPPANDGLESNHEGTTAETTTSADSTETDSTESETESDATESETDSTETDSTETDSTETETETETDTDTDPELGVPFGFWGLNGLHSLAGFEDVQTRFNAGLVQVAAGNPNWTVTTFLPIAREAGMKVTLRLAGDHAEYTTDGNFDLALWKAQIDPWEAVGLEEFIADGTLVGHMVLDDIGNWSWPDGGVDPTGDELEEMARYSKEKLPGLMTFVRERATEVPVPTGGVYVDLDACVNQYRVLEGDVATYASEQRATALALGLGVINGLNLCDGGDGSSGQQGWRGPGFWAMSASEITTYGEALIVDDLGLFLAWEYDAIEVWPDGTIGAQYLDQPEIEAALAGLGALLAEQPQVDLFE